MDLINIFWSKFLEGKENKDSFCYGGEISFGTDEYSSAELTALVLSGRKSASVSALEAFKIDNEPLPKAGVYYVLTDWSEKPCAVIKTENVQVLPYNEVTWEMAQKEDSSSSMEEWRYNHNLAFEDDAAVMGYDLTPDMPVVYEEFRVVYRQ